MEVGTTFDLMRAFEWASSRDTVQRFLESGESKLSEQSRSELGACLKKMDKALTAGLHFDSSVEVLVLEGLDGVGKSSIRSSLVSALKALLHPEYDVIDMQTPSAVFAPFRKEFQSVDIATRFAFYNLCNFQFVLDVKEYRSAHLASNPRKLVVVLDRWWISSVCGATLEQHSSGAKLSHIPPVSWPVELPRPSTVTIVCLTVSEATRIERMGKRESQTWQECQLQEDHEARKCVTDVHKHFAKLGSLFFVPNDKSVQECVQTIIKVHSQNKERGKI